MTVNERVIKRFIIIAGIALAIGFGIYLVSGHLNPPPGDFATRQGANLLTDKHYDDAIEAFDQALAEIPDHPGALMGKAIAHLQMGNDTLAELILQQLISKFEPIPEKSDLERARLAAAYQNIAILYDRRKQYKEALYNYRLGIITDRDTVDGPGFVDGILYGPGKSNAIKRAKYLARQFKLPESKRVFHVPKIDAEQRMHRP